MVYQQKSISNLGFMIFYIFTSGNTLNIVTGSRVQEFYGKTWLIFCPSFYKQCIFDLVTNNTYLIPLRTIRLKMYLIFMFLCHMWIRNWVFQSWLLGVQLFTVYYNIYFNFIYSWWVVIRCSILWVVAGAVVGRKRPQAPSASAPWPSPVLSSCAMSLHMDTTTRASPQYHHSNHSHHKSPEVWCASIYGHNQTKPFVYYFCA